MSKFSSKAGSIYLHDLQFPLTHPQQEDITNRCFKSPSSSSTTKAYETTRETDNCFPTYTALHIYSTQMQLRWVRVSTAEEMWTKVRPMIDTEMFSNASIIAADSGPHVSADDLLPRCFPNYLQTTSPVRWLLRRSEVITPLSPRIGNLGTCDGGGVSVRKNLVCKEDGLQWLLFPD